MEHDDPLQTSVVQHFSDVQCLNHPELFTFLNQPKNGTHHMCPNPQVGQYTTNYYYILIKQSKTDPMHSEVFESAHAEADFHSSI